MLNRILVCTLCALGFAATLTFLYAQQASGPRRAGETPGVQQTPVFRARADYVPVDVVVTDQNDEPLTGLTVDDFEIYDNGMRQSISDFKFVSIPVGARDVTAESATTASQTVATNELPSADSRLFVLLIDDVHTLESELISVKQVMTDFVRALSPDDEVGIVFAGRSDLGLNFTTDVNRMLQAIERTRGALGFGLDALGRSANSERRGDARLMQSAGRTTAFALKNIARALAGSRHQRRAIIYVGGGSAIDHDETAWTDPAGLDLKAAFEEARRANVPIYSLDPRGMVQPPDAVRGGIGALNGGGSMSTYAVMKQIQIQQNTLAVTSVNTGGRAFLNQSDLTGAIDAIVRENGSFYLLGYYPSPAVRDGAFHPIDVRVTRPGARVRARAGYLASAASTPDASTAERLATAMVSGVDMRGLTLRAQVTPLLPTDRGMRCAVTIQVTYPTLVTDQPFDKVQVQVVGLDGDAKIRASSDNTYTFKPPMVNRGSATFVINSVIDLPAEPLAIRIGVSSLAHGRTGTVQLPMQVPKPSDSKLQLGGVALGFDGPPRESALGDIEARSLLPFQPTTSRTFSQRDTLRVFMPILWREGTDEVRVTLTLKGRSATIRRDEPLTAKAGDRGRHVAAFDTLLPLARLSGPVTLQLDARLANGQTATETVAFDVLPSGK